MVNLKGLLDRLHESFETSTAEEITEACKLIVEVQALDASERDVINAAYKRGPLFAGDVPSKNARNSLVDKGFMTYVVVKGDDRFNACTNKGAWAYRLIEAGA